MKTFYIQYLYKPRIFFNYMVYHSYQNIVKYPPPIDKVDVDAGLARPASDKFRKV